MNMKKGFYVLLAIFFCLPFYLQAKKQVKITVIPEDATIFVDNSYAAKGIYFVDLPKKEGHIRVKIEREGYVTRRLKITEYEKRKSIDIQMDKDDAWEASSNSQVANRFFTIPVSDKYIAHAGNKDEAAKLAWKQLHQILLKYIEEIEESNMLGGFIQSAWYTKRFYNSSLNDIDGGIQWRTRVVIKETSDGDNLAYRLKITSEVAPLNAMSDEYFVPVSRVLKTFEPMIQEFQSRLSDM